MRRGSFSVLATAPHLPDGLVLTGLCLADALIDPSLHVSPPKWLRRRPRMTQRTRGVAATPTLLIDNYDSYTYNLYQLIAQTHGREPVVILNDELTIAEIEELVLSRGIRSAIISPGPGGPDNPTDIGVCAEFVRSFPWLPILGVCLGHQILASAYGGKTSRVSPVHGRLSGVLHQGHSLFDQIPISPELQVVRYHSLAVEECSLPACLKPIAWTSGGSHTLKNSKEWSVHERVLMGLAHEKYPHYGVQFHPESVGSTYGEQLLANFRSLAGAAHLPNPQSIPRVHCRPKQEEAEQKPSLDITWQRLEGKGVGLDMDALFDHLFCENEFADTFWLDSAAEERCRFSFMGGPGGPLWKRLVYQLTSPTGGELVVRDRSGSQETWSGSIWNFLRKELNRCQSTASPELPFDFCGGFVGYLGYELKTLCGGGHLHEAPTPDASMFFVDRFIAVDHLVGDVYCVALHSLHSQFDRRAAHEWTESTAKAISAFSSPAPQRRYRGVETEKDGEFRLDRDRSGYIADIGSCMELLHSGDSYEICLTNKFRKSKTGHDERELYRHLRYCNPAPYSAWLKFGSGQDALTICCSSPERFLKGDRDGTLEAKPIKGTAPRSPNPHLDRMAAQELQESEKDQSENLMIVDLLRNDLGRVCEPSSIHVPCLMETESFATVHQLVSTIRGKRRKDVSIIDAIQAGFPGGSMTGAPKIRTMKILDTLEGAARGVYSGCLGYLSVNGTFDLNIVIRTAVLTGEEIVIGCGGAIVLQSDASDEFEEMQQKAQALKDAVHLWERNLGN